MTSDRNERLALWIGLGIWRLTIYRDRRPVFERTDFLIVGFGVEQA